MKNNIWYKQLGFYNNPFSTKPAAFNDELFGRENQLNKVLKLIEDGKVAHIQGDYGLGKTTVLKRVVREFGGDNKIIYYNCNAKNKHINFVRLLNNRYGFIGRLFDIRPKDMILLLDEISELNQTDEVNLSKMYDEGFFKAVVLVSVNGKSISKDLAKFIGKNKIELNKMNNDDAIKLVRKRIGDLPLLSDEMVLEIFKKSKYNPRQLLANCEDVCRQAIDNFDDQVVKEHIDEILK